MELMPRKQRAETCPAAETVTMETQCLLLISKDSSSTAVLANCGDLSFPFYSWMKLRCGLAPGSFPNDRVVWGEMTNSDPVSSAVS